MTSTGSGRQPFEVALFVTCLVDLFRPAVGFAAVRLLQEAGCEVLVPASQTCCGQPAYNSGDRKAAKAVAQQVIAAFEPYPYIVVPSGSCAGMLSKHYPSLFDPDKEPSWHARASAFAARVFELTSFLSDVLGVDFAGRSYARRVTYHDSCSSLREMGIAAQPRRLLQSLDGIVVVEMGDREVCCGFGGTFCIKYPDISNAMVTQKAGSIVETQADVLAGADLGCLMNIGGKLAREGKKVEIRHIAEILAGELEGPGFCAG